MEVASGLRSIDARLLIGGRWEEASGGETSAVASPATGETLGFVPQATVSDVDRAVRSAASVADDWGTTTPFKRAESLKRLVAVIDSRRAELALTLALEQGKPLKAEAYGEVDAMIGHFEVAIEEGKRLEGLVLPSSDPAKRVFAFRVPRGVVGAIQPWNFPLECAAMQIAPALASGNPVVMLPAPTTSLIAYELARCADEAELPDGVLNFLTGQGPVVGDALVSHPGVQAVAFTGSAATGEIVAKRSGGKAQLLELGGNGPVVVLEDADVDLVIPSLVRGCFRCSGQACTGPERILVADPLYDEVAERLAAAVIETVRLGHPLHEETTMGPLNNETLAAKVDAHVEDALARGARVLAGGQRVSGHPTDLYWAPTVLSDVTEGMSLSSEETFGPVAPLQRIGHEAEAVASIADSRYGLAVAIYTRDLNRALRFAERAKAGMVNINERPNYTEYHLPFGGSAGKSSGIGRAQGRFPMEDVFTELKTVILHLGDSA
jgi:acyl-CoA reductase-like NAD-dependent aldehyde dehydrogenase